MRFQVAGNESTPIDVLDLLLDDPEEIVRNRVSESLVSVETE